MKQLFEYKTKNLDQNIYSVPSREIKMDLDRNYFIDNCNNYNNNYDNITIDIKLKI